MWQPGDVVSGPATNDLFLVLHDGSFCRLRHNDSEKTATPSLLGKSTFPADRLSVINCDVNKKLFNLFELIEQVGI